MSKKIMSVPIRFVEQVYINFIEDGCLTRAAALAFTTLLSLVPLMTVSFTILHAFPVFKDIGEKVQKFVFSNFVAGSAELIQSHLLEFASQASKLSATGLLFLLLSAVLMIFNMERAFNTIWRVKELRKGVSAFLMYWAVLTLSPILIGVGFAISSYIFSLPLITMVTGSLGMKTPLLTYGPYFFTFLGFTLLYIAVPNCKVPLRFGVVGGLVAATLFELAKYGFGLYLKFFPTYELLYGALATIPIFLVWVYLSWSVILFGVVISYVLTTKAYLVEPEVS